MGNQAFWQLDQCSNADLLAGLAHIVRSSRRQTAELIAHLGEVEARRLHLEAACASMFDYCVKRLGLSEDEACRRIDVARLARRFPELFPRLASGEISLTVAVLLKPHLRDENRADLIARIAGKTIKQARDALAARFPQPEVPSSVRKLPERQATRLAAPDASPQRLLPALIVGTGSPPVPAIMPARSEPAPLAAPIRKPTTVIEPLSVSRYRVQLTANVSLKEKLERARDLTRHRNPSGDLAVVVERALDVLLEQLMKERFGVTSKPRPRGAASSQRVSNATRRALLERDGLRCTWTDDAGRRCESRGWLELDHREPRGKGGSSELSNMRVLCAGHNRLAAEREYGHAFIEAAIARRRGG